MPKRYMCQRIDRSQAALLLAGKIVRLIRLNWKVLPHGMTGVFLEFYIHWKNTMVSVIAKKESTRLICGVIQINIQKVSSLTMVYLILMLFRNNAVPQCF